MIPSLYQLAIHSIKEKTNNFNKLGLPRIISKNIKDCCGTINKLKIVYLYEYFDDSISNNHVNCFKTRFSHLTDTTRKQFIIIRVAQCGNFDILKYLNSMGYIKKYISTNLIANYNFMNGIMKHIDCLKYLYKNGYALTGNIRYSNLACLEYAHENGCPWNESTCDKAAETGNLDCLEYAHKHGCPWNESTCNKAAETGNLMCLKYAHEHGCPWSESTCAKAAVHNNIACLKYAHEHGCPWDQETCFNAACNGNLACLEYAHKNGCQMDILIISNKECYDYVAKHGCLANSVLNNFE